MGIKIINRHGTSSLYRLEKTMKRITKENIIIVITIIIEIISVVFFLSIIEQKNKIKKSMINLNMNPLHCLMLN